MSMEEDSADSVEPAVQCLGEKAAAESTVETVGKKRPRASVSAPR